MDKLNLIETFLVVSRAGSFAAASAQLGVDPSTVSKSIQQLEKHLGFRLFHRTTRRLQLTSSGEIYRQKCAELFDGLESCEQQLGEEQAHPQGMLRVNLPVAYGQLYIAPLLGRFYEAYPDIQLEISLSDDYIDMVANSIDVAIRSGQMQDSRLVARKLSPMDFATCASPEFLAQNAPITANNIENQRWIGYRFIHTGRLMPLYGMKGKSKSKQTYEINPSPVLVTTDGLSLVSACKAGVGLMQGPHFLLRDAVRSGELVLVQSYYRYEPYNVYAYYSYRDYMPMKVRVFLDFVTEELKKMGEDHQSTFLSG